MILALTCLATAAIAAGAASHLAYVVAPRSVLVVAVARSAERGPWRRARAVLFAAGYVAAIALIWGWL